MDIQNIIINTVEIILKYVNTLWVTPLATLNPHLSAIFMIFNTKLILCRGIARLNLILFRAHFL